MNLYYLGQPYGELPQLKAETPPFRVDGIIVVNEAALSENERDLLAYYRRHGRPIGTSPAEVKDQPRTNYTPINCSFYDNFEAAIVTRRGVALEYRQPDDTVQQINIRLQDLKTHLTEEYVQLSTGEWLRLDRIVSVDGAAAGASCRF